MDMHAEDGVRRVILVVMDGVGIGASPDARLYGDAGSASLQNTAERLGGLKLPVLSALGLGAAARLTGRSIAGVSESDHTIGSFGVMQEVSRGKDTITGHWEISGLQLTQAFPTYPHGFPAEVIDAFRARIGRNVLGNRVASGTVIIEELGEEHMKTGSPIVYTSADSVFQVAAHEDVIPVEELYRICEVARGILTGPHLVARVIARPFAGAPGSFHRTERRKDFAVAPPEDTILDIVKSHGRVTVGVGKIEDIFSGKGISVASHTYNSAESMRETISRVKTGSGDFIFTNCIDFDMLWGHRNDPQGYADALGRFDADLGELVASIGPGDLLIVTADHGNDPTTSSTDHSREYVPLLTLLPGVSHRACLGVRQGFFDVAATVSEALLGTVLTSRGRSFWPEISRRAEG